MERKGLRAYIKSIIKESAEIIDITGRLPEKPSDPVMITLEDIYEQLGALDIPSEHPAASAIEEILSILDEHFASDMTDEDGDGDVSADERRRFLDMMNRTRDLSDEDED